MTTSSLGSTVSRRRFIQGSGLIIGLTLISKGQAKGLIQGDIQGAQGEQAAMNAFVRVAPDNSVTVLSKHLEMGQGPYTGLTQLVAEEMNADWAQMGVEAAPADDDAYKNMALGMQITGGSTSIANSYEQLRRAGATAKAMLLMAAAARWQVPQSSLQVKAGEILHTDSGKKATFGELANDAASFSPPEKVTLKSPSDFTIIGKAVKRLDTPAKTNGSAIFTLDVLADGMLTAVVLHPPQFGATVASMDASDARAVKGVVDIKTISQGVAVYAENTYAALKGRDKLKVSWDTSKAEKRSSQQIAKDFHTAMQGEGITATNNGDVQRAFSQKGVTLHEAEYHFPYLAHAPMETLDALLMRDENGQIQCFSGAQMPGGDADVIAEICGVARKDVIMNVQYAGGSFGRRAQFGSPYMKEAAEVFKASGMTRPVRHMWTREDDIKGGYYRPLAIHKLKGAIDKQGNIIAWQQKIACQSIMGKKDKLDEVSVEGAHNIPYEVENHAVYAYNTEAKVPVLWWRSVGHTHTGYTVETFLDELLEKAGKDPIAGRKAMLDPQSRQYSVLDTVEKMVAKAGAPKTGCQRGVAVHKSFNSYVAQIAEVSKGKRGEPRVERVWVAVDCGVAVNPNHIAAQMEGGVGFGIGAILYDEITLEEGGTVAQSNFHDYRSLRIDEMPHVEVEVVNSSEAPTGVGEPGVPPIGPALANAWRRLTGENGHTLPLVKPSQARGA